MPISCDTDIVNAEKRRNLYTKRRELIMKLASEDTLEHKDFERFSRKADMEKFY